MSERRDGRVRDKVAWGGGVSSVQLVEGRRNRGVCKHVGRGKGPFRRGEAKISRVIL